MYRPLVAILLCQAVTPAPQYLDSDITYVKLQPSDAPKAPSHYRESRIENIPLTIPGVPAGTLDKDHEKLTWKTEVNDELDDLDTLLAERSEIKETVVLPDEPLSLPESTNISEETVLPERDVPGNINLPEEVALPESSNLPDRPIVSDESSNLSEQLTAQDKNVTRYDPANKSAENGEKSSENSAQTERSDLTEELLEAHGSLSDTVPAETLKSERHGRTYESGESTDIFEEVTERYVDHTQRAEVEPPRTRATPKYIPKLSYFSKPTYSLPVNSLEKAGKRRFRSNCRCEKIWNCPKLQITVPRCPDEYFLCCF